MKKYSGAEIRRALGLELNLGEVKVDFSDWTIFEDKKENIINLIKFTLDTKEGYKFNFDAEQLKLEDETPIKKSFQQLYNTFNSENLNVVFHLALRENKDNYKFDVITLRNEEIKSLSKIQVDKASNKRGFLCKHLSGNKYAISLFPYPISYEKINLESNNSFSISDIYLQNAKKSFKEENHCGVDWNRLLSRSYDKANEKAFSKEEYKNKIFKEYCDIEKFEEKFFGTKERCCAYCGIQESNLDKLQTIRAGRGKRLEYDRIDSSKDYELDNIVLACYWCNNAKTDTFSAKEFQEIARGINAVWESRGADIIEFNEDEYKKRFKIHE